MVDYIYRAVVKNNGEQITYHNTQGKNISYKPSEDGHILHENHAKRKDATILFNTVTKYFTKNSPNITPEEQVKIRAEIAKQQAPISGLAANQGHALEKLNLYEGIDFVLKTFSDEASEGSKNITPNEVYQMYEIFHEWTK